VDGNGLAPAPGSTGPLAPQGSLVDVEGLSVGHHTDTRRPTGCTVVLCDGDGAVCGVAQRGGAPGTRETDLLRPENTVGRVHAVLLTGGSAFGLDAAGGVVRWLEQRDRGLLMLEPGSGRRVRVPIVPAAVLFDLWVGDGSIRPDAHAGESACAVAGRSTPAEGSVGAGTGAAVGKLLGFARAMKGGIGQASMRVGGVTVAAMVAANPVGDVRDDQGRLLAGARTTAESLSLADLDAALQRGEGPAPALLPMAGTATTIGVVATDARLDKAQATQLASLAHAGLARAISPLTPNDGDTLFALATGRVAGPGNVTALGALAAACVARAIRRAVLAATAVEQPWLPAARDLPGAARIG
jgi:L-aminopeptidase/D-esterase-like protein